MISNQIIKNAIEELKEVTRVDFAVFDMEGKSVVSTWPHEEIGEDILKQFSVSIADSQKVYGCHFFKVYDEKTAEFMLVAKGSADESYVIGKVAVCELQNLIIAYKEKFDKNNFIQNLILDNLLLVDIYNRAKKLRINVNSRRIVYIIEHKSDSDTAVREILKEMFGSIGNHFVTEVDEKSMILVQELEEQESYDDVAETAEMIYNIMATDAMTTVRIAYGTIVNEIQQVSKSYKEAKMALNVGKIFYTEKKIHDYHSLGIGRLIYQLPANLCEMFIQETFTEEIPNELDEETLITIGKFFENNLNVSETARQLFIHRNTLVYRLEKLQKVTGLDIRTFDDALTFKIALMVLAYMDYMKEEGL